MLFTAEISHRPSGTHQQRADAWRVPRTAEIWLLSLMGLTSCAHNASNATVPPFREVLAQAAHSEMGIVVEFTAKWCKPCQYFEQWVLPSEAVQQALQDLVFVRYDIQRSADEEYPRLLGFRGVLPLFVALDSDGVVRGRFAGLPEEPKDAAEVLRQAALLTGSERRILSIERGAPNDPETLLWVARWYQARARGPAATARINRALAQPGLPKELREALEQVRTDPLKPAPSR